MPRPHSALPDADPFTDDLVDAFAAGRRRRALHDAEEIRTLARAAARVSAAPADARVGRREEQFALRSLAAELATAAALSERTVTRLLDEAIDLCARFEAGVDALARGEISRGHLAVIHEAGALIADEADRGAYVAAALERAPQLTPGRLGALARSLAERRLPRALEERHAAAHETRRVRVHDLDDGMADLVATLPAVLARGIHDRLTAHARSVIAAGAEDSSATEADPRTMDQLRADAFADLLLTARPPSCAAGEGIDAIRAIVQVTVPVLTMTGAGAEPCLLAGHGPIDAGTARALAAAAPGWERVMTSPATGAVLAVDRYRPSTELKRFLRARDERCRFPGCRRCAARCDLDHTVDAARGGPTAPENLAHLCRRHHTLKHASAWSVRQEAAGVLVWTSPSGREHTDRPEPTLRFVPDDRPPPADDGPLPF